MSRSVSKHRLSNRDFKSSRSNSNSSSTPLYHPASVPTCKCGTQFDVYGLHPHSVASVTARHIRPSFYINEHGLKPLLQQILPTAGIMSDSSFVQTEVKGHFPPITTQRQVKKPFDVQRSPEHGLGLGDSALPPSPFAICGADLTIDHSPDPPPYSGLCPCKQFFTFTAHADDDDCLQ